MRAVDLMLRCGLVLLTAACTGGHPDVEPAPSATPSSAQRELHAGTNVDLTAVVSRVYGEHAFVVDDADLPPDGQLVVSAAAVTVFVDDLVTLSGTAERLDATALRQYGAATTTAVAVIATSVRRYPARSATP
ncbi:hypothetical protein Dvina_31670 [Dactylosporangium vinaceum]|uniref:DUF5666 domain-containing protein n=1 Tax=Dactylosporangium vinaceum TaxID=53362 RepID=A0ABV5MAV0_9ACTN|nr:hypothetical protein [Dactylosporangium vinaceum]UAB92858.1 hypothetical protein Dvina_31670 [Dactylosporangium vinaceum]